MISNKVGKTEAHGSVKYTTGYQKDKNLSFLLRAIMARIWSDNDSISRSEHDEAGWTPGFWAD